MTDPFADIFSDTPPADSWSEPTTEGRPVTASTEGKVVTTLKGGSGFEAPWIVLHAGSVEESEELLNGVYSRGYHERVQKAATLFNGGKTSSGSGGRSGGGNANPPGMQVKTCSHGDMTYRTGTGAKGPWKAWFCSAAEKADQCSPVWVK